MAHEQACELKTLVQSHALVNIKVAAGLMSGPCLDQLEKRWVHVHSKGSGPEIKKYPVVPLGNELPEFPPCQVLEAALPEISINAATLRVTIPFCFCRHSWRHCQHKPATCNMISGMLRDFDLQESFITSYRCRTLQSQQWTGYAEAVMRFLKIDKSELDSILKISGKH